MIVRITRASVVLALSLVLLGTLLSVRVQAQSTTTAPPDFSFDAFAGTYYLDRDTKGAATLTVEEDMVVEFPINSNLFGIKRSIPETYQGHNLNLKIISVTDAIGNPVLYHISSDGKGDEIIETGDPDIILSGVQTYRIKYQTSGVVSFNGDSDQFLLDVNGRDWQETFASVKAFINIAKNFVPNIVGKPSCYIGTGTYNLGTCTVQATNHSDGSELITATTTTELTAHQGLVVNLNFRNGTFQQKNSSSHIWQIFGILLAGTLLCCGLFLLIKYII